jgi:hypothetical protein
VKSYKRTRAGLNGISTSSSDVYFQLRIVSTSAAKRYIEDELKLLTLDVEIITVSDG